MIHIDDATLDDLINSKLLFYKRCEYTGAEHIMNAGQIKKLIRLIDSNMSDNDILKLIRKTYSIYDV